MKFSLIASVASLLLASGAKARSSFPPGLTWNYILSEDNFKLSKEKAQVIVTDVHSTSKETIQRYHDSGKKVICYFSGGSYERFRKDKNEMKNVSGLIGYDDKLDGWDEYYLDVSNSGIKPIMRERIKLAREKHCDGIEADNLDVCSNEEHLHLSTNDCVKYAKWLAKTAHENDISIGLKNSRYIADQVADDFDFAINESCFTHGEYCHNYKKLFLDQGKAVFAITYNNYLKNKGGISALCKHINGLPISMIVKETQDLVQEGYIVNSKVCGSSFSSGVKKSKPTTKKTTTTTKKTTTKKTTTTTTTVKKTTVKAKPTTAVKPVKPISNKVIPVNNAVNNAPKITPAAQAKVQAPAQTPKAPVTEEAKSEKKETLSPVAPVANEIEEPTGNEGSGSGVATGVAVTGSVLGAAGAFLFLQKKNPKQYQNLKRSLSEKATTLKRGASTISRRATERATTLSRKMSKRNKPTTPQTTIDPTNTSYTYQFESYRYQFTQNLDFDKY